MLKMIPQSKNNCRDRARPSLPRNTRPVQATQQAAPHYQSQWQQKYDHYCRLAQATNGGDAVTREQHWQHAEHYLRLMNGSAN